MDARLILERNVEAVLGITMSFPHDYCATFARDVIKDAHGIDVLGNRFGGEFAETEADAYRAYPLGLAVTAARRMREIGWRKIPPVEAAFGDFAVVRVHGYGHGIAVAIGGGWFCRRLARGVRFDTSNHVVACWTPQGDASWQ